MQVCPPGQWFSEKTFRGPLDPEPTGLGDHVGVVHHVPARSTVPGIWPALRVPVGTTYTCSDPLGTIILASGDWLLFLSSVTSLTLVT